MYPRERLEQELDALAAALPAMRDQHPDPGDFAMAFAGVAELIEDNAGPEDAGYVSRRIDELLASVAP